MSLIQISIIHFSVRVSFIFNLVLPQPIYSPSLDWNYIGVCRNSCILIKERRYIAKNNCCVRGWHEKRYQNWVILLNSANRFIVIFVIRKFVIHNIYFQNRIDLRLCSKKIMICKMCINSKVPTIGQLQTFRIQIKPIFTIDGDCRPFCQINFRINE